MKSAPRVSLISLGCAKNQVDSERMLGALSANGYDLVEDPAASDLVIVNTCGFIESAKAESIDTILEAAQLTGDTGGGEPKKLVVAGCLVERYLDELKSELEHEVDVFVTLSEEQRIVAACDDALGVVRGTTTEWEGRHLISPSHWAYLKIAEGCDHTCSFCAIPSIRGKHNSVPMEALEEEAARLAQGGVKELNLVAQDTTLYGADIYDRKSLPKLLERLNEVDGIMWLRLFYAHPANVSDDLIDAIAYLDRVVPYLDMPIQHVNDDLLSLMRRKTKKKKLSQTVGNLRERVPDITLRTSVIVGHPQETDEKFEELLEFLEEIGFDRLGCFTYSEEETTRSAEFEDDVPDAVKQERRALVMALQDDIANSQGMGCLGSDVEVMIDASCDGGYFGRSTADAPEVDGRVLVRSESHHLPGDLVTARLIEADGYDFVGDDISGFANHEPRQVDHEQLSASLPMVS